MEEVECGRGFRTSSSSWLELGASGMVCGAYFLLLPVSISQQSCQCTPVSGPGAEGGWGGGDLINDHSNDRDFF